MLGSAGEAIILFWKQSYNLMTAPIWMPLEFTQMSTQQDDKETFNQ